MHLLLRDGIDYKVNFGFGDLEVVLQNYYELEKDEYIFSLATPFGDVEGTGKLSYSIFDRFYIKSWFESHGLGDELGKAKMEEIEKVDKLIELLLMRLKENLDEKLTFVSTKRGKVKFSDKPEVTQDIGHDGENLLKGLGYAYLSAHPDVKKELSDLLGEWAKKFGIEDLNAGLEGGELKAIYRDIEKLNLASASYGQRQFITFLTQLIVSPRGSVIIIEEPELSLHPEYQAILPLLFADIIKKHKKQIIISTHSTILPLTISDVVAGESSITFNGAKIKIEEPLNVNEIALYHVKRGKDSSTEAEMIELTEEGYPEFLPSFAKVEAEIFEKISERVLR